MPTKRKRSTNQPATRSKSKSNVATPSSDQDQPELLSLDDVREQNLQTKPKNTVIANQTGVNNFEVYRLARNTMCEKLDRPEEDYCRKDLHQMNVEELVKWLTLYTKAANGSLHSSTIRSYLASIRRSIYEKTGEDHDILSVSKASPFALIKETLNSVSKTQKQKGIGTRKKQAEYITVSMEGTLVSYDLLGHANAFAMNRSLHRMNCLFFGMRGRENHRDLKITDYDIGVDNESGKRFVYMTRDLVDKNHNGNVDAPVESSRFSNIPKAFEEPERMELCPVTLIETLKKHRTADSEHLYQTPCKRKSDPHVWFKSTPLGIHEIEKLVPSMMDEADIAGYYTSHSWRATAVSRMLTAGCSTSLVKHFTGHMSDKAVAVYDRLSSSSQVKGSSALSGCDPVVSPPSPSVSTYHHHQSSYQRSQTQMAHVFQQATLSNCTIHLH